MPLKPILLLLLALAVWTSPAQAHDNDVYTAAVKVDQLLQTTTTTIGQPIRFPQDGQAQLTFLKVTIPPGAETGWHRHPVPGAGYILSGKLTLLVDGGRVFELTSGQAFTETVDTLHNGKNLGAEPVVLLVTWLGQEGKPYTVKGTPP